MPKMKTHKAAAKRFRVTGSGKVVRRKMNRGHLLSKKSGARKRSLAQDIQVHPGLIKRVERMLGIRALRRRRPAPGAATQD
ncbi:MAG TPA: 50S ribosomal protein L35 [bacterium]|nr:50S ribosomal protein L35 [bacterium]